MNSFQSVKRDMLIEAPLEKVWSALTEAEQLTRWYAKDASVDFRVGGRMELDHGWGASTSGVITEIEHGKHFILQGEDMSLTITTLTQEAAGVRVAIEYRLELPLGDAGQAIADNMAYGTLLFLHNLKSVYETGQDTREKMWRTWIGFQHMTVHPQAGQPAGSKVLTVKDSSPAAAAGLGPNDVIVNINNTTISSYSDLEAAIRELAIDEQVSLTVWRNGDTISITCGIGSYPVPYCA